MFRNTLAGLAALAITATAATAGQTQPDPGLAALRALEDRLETAIDTALPSVVTVGRRVVPSPRNRPEAGVDPSWFQTEPVGTGVAIRPGGFILTTHHLVVPPTEEDRWDLHVWLPGGRRLPAGIVAADPRSDLAVLKVDAPDLKALPVVPPEARNPLRRGRIVLVLSRPTGEAGEGLGAATWAMVSHTAPRLDADARLTIHTDGTLIQIDARMPDVGSGAAVVDLEGRLVAVTTAAEAIAGFQQRGTFAIPVFDRFDWVVERLSAGLPVEYGFLGVTRNVVERFGAPGGIESEPPGVTLTDVLPASPAARAGLRAGDRILEMDGEPIRGFSDLTRHVGLMPTGAACRVRLIRDDRQVTATVTLGKYPVVGRSIATAGPRPWRGMQVDWATVMMTEPEVVQRLAVVQEKQPAVVVTECREESPADRAGMMAGRVILEVGGTPVTSPAQCRELLRSGEGDVKIETDAGVMTVPER